MENQEKESQVKILTVEETEKLPKAFELWTKTWFENVFEEIKKQINKK